MGDDTRDMAMMRRALDLARHGEATARPNPIVGAVVVSEDGRIVGEGWHLRPGEPHAEPLALDAAGADAAGGTLYVTLEPCSHWGRTPPCTERILASGVSRVVIAVEDSNPAAGGGAHILRDAGLHVDIGVLRSEARAVNRPFFSMMERRRPWVTAKLAMSLDGRVATRTGDSQWITSAQSRAHGHQLRAASDGVLVGSGTALADDPRLDARTDPPPDKPPLRIVLDTAGRVEANARVFDPDVLGPVLIATTPSSPQHVRDAWSAAGAQILVLGHDHSGRVDIAEFLRELAKRNVSRLLVEGGPMVLGAFFDAGFIDEVVAYVAPIVIGGAEAPAAIGGLGADGLCEAKTLSHLTSATLGPDICLRGLISDLDERSVAATDAASVGETV